MCVQYNRSRFDDLSPDYYVAPLTEHARVTVRRPRYAHALRDLVYKTIRVLGYRVRVPLIPFRVMEKQQREGNACRLKCLLACQHTGNGQC